MTSNDDARVPSSNVIVRFRVPGLATRYHAHDLTLERGSRVLVESETGPVLGTVLKVEGADQATTPVHHAVLRQTDAHDEEQILRHQLRDKEAFAFCQERIRALNLPMKLVDVEFAFAGTRAVFSFSSGERVDFRALVKDLARRFHTRIEMRQIGVRDAARYAGGIGICGQKTCCSTFLPDFKPISIRMAKDQNLTLNHQKLSGVCGRLRCCLQYEQSTYQASQKGLPKVGKRVMTPAGDGRVRDINTLQRRIRVQLTAGGFADFEAHEVTRIANPESGNPSNDEPS